MPESTAPAPAKPAPAESKPLWRQAYDAWEQAVTPSLQEVTASNGFRDLLAFGLKTNADITREIERASRQWLHLLNLPAATDVRRLRQQVSGLEREILALRNELERQGGDTTTTGMAPKAPRAPKAATSPKTGKTAKPSKKATASKTAKPGKNGIELTTLTSPNGANGHTATA